VDRSLLLFEFLVQIEIFDSNLHEFILEAHQLYMVATLDPLSLATT